MTTFFVGSATVDLPGVQISPPEETASEGAWLHKTHISIRLSAPVEGFRVHTNGIAYPTGLPFGKRAAPRVASEGVGRWVLIGDGAISTSSEIVRLFSLPGAFSHVSKAIVPALCLVNVGICSTLFGGIGGGLQIEYVSGPPIRFHEMTDAVWLNTAGNA
jgi:hypothetical protein